VIEYCRILGQRGNLKKLISPNWCREKIEDMGTLLKKKNYVVAHQKKTVGQRAFFGRGLNQRSISD